MIWKESPRVFRKYFYSLIEEIQNKIGTDLDSIGKNELYDLKLKIIKRELYLVPVWSRQLSLLANILMNLN